MEERGDGGWGCGWVRNVDAPGRVQRARNRVRTAAASAAAGAIRSGCPLNERSERMATLQEQWVDGGR